MISPSNLYFNAILIGVALTLIYILIRPRLRQSEMWQATLTPLSSIIGSGFLVMAPLLASIVGYWAPVAVCGIVILAYAIGHAVRFNILHIEPRFKETNRGISILEIDYLGKVVLVIAYVIAVAFYLSLLSNFLLNYVGLQDPFLERCITTSIITFVGIVGYLKGLGGLEKLESFSMTIQLAVLCALLVGVGIFALQFFGSATIEIHHEQHSLDTKIRMLAGVLLVVQGFETSRFLGEKYSPAVRVKSMRIAQLMSGALYIGSVLLLMPVVQSMNLIEINLAEIVTALAPVAVVLPATLMIAALMSQFSAAVADTGGGGGLLSENSGRRLSTRIGYGCVCISAILLVWAVDLLQIITLASRAFAAYYFIQAILAFIANHQFTTEKTTRYWLRQTLFLCLAVILAYIVVFSIPAD